MKKVVNEFPLRLTFLLYKYNIKSETLSKTLGFGVHMISLYAAGKCEPTLSKLIKIADYFNVSLDWLVGRENYNERNNED